MEIEQPSVGSLMMSLIIQSGVYFQEYAERLGDSKEPQTYIDELKRKRDAFYARFGPAFGEPNGWAAEALEGTTRRPIHFR